MKLGLLLFTLVFAFTSANDCIWSHTNDMGTFEFDLSVLNTDEKIYDVEDKYSHLNRGYHYLFNVCGNTHTIPEGPTGQEDACQTTGTEGLTGPSPVYQIAHSSTTATEHACHRLGGTFDNDANYEYSLAYPSHPNRGVTLTYLNGDECSNGDNRKLSLTFECVDDLENIPDEELVEEIAHCHYEIRIRTSAACPLSCPRDGDKVCGHHGVCGYDKEIKSTRCFCNEGFEGDACGSKSSGEGVTFKDVIMSLIVICLLAGLGVLMYMFIRLRKLTINDDSNNETDFKVELGQI